LIDRYPLVNPLTIKEYEIVEDWYLSKAIDKNVANILKIGEMHKSFLEILLFREESIPFEIDRPTIKTLHVNGLITIFIKELDGKMYREAFAALGNTDMIINVKGVEYFLEMKKYYSPSYFRKGKKQLAYYYRSFNILEGHYIVFVDNTINPEYLPDKPESVDGIMIHTYLIWFDEEKDF
jgi:hypothetical protein